MSKRIKLVIHHGAQPTEPSELATKLIQENCKRLGIDYCSTPFFHNANSAGIQQAMSKVAPKIKVIFDRFFGRSTFELRVSPRFQTNLLFTYVLSRLEDRQ